jgi:hypothetical protein
MRFIGSVFVAFPSFPYCDPRFVSREIQELIPTAVPLPLYASWHFCSSPRLVTREGSRGIWLAIMIDGFAVLWVAWGTLSLPDLIEICVGAGALLVSVAVGLVASRWGDIRMRDSMAAAVLRLSRFPMTRLKGDPEA